MTTHSPVPKYSSPYCDRHSRSDFYQQSNFERKDDMIDDKEKIMLNGEQEAALGC